MGPVLVTGADGFVGGALCKRLSSSGRTVRGIARRATSNQLTGIGDIVEFQGWPSLLANVEVVVHLAARAHEVSVRSASSIEAFRRVNVDATLRIAEAAVAAGVRRFVFLSSIGVNGTSTGNRPFVESDSPNVTEPYARSKWEAEQALMQLGYASGLEVIRVRPPLILGAGAKGNLRRLMALVDSGLPLPLGAISNRRNFVELEDLCDLLVRCVSDPRAANELFLVADPREVSTGELIQHIADALGKRARLVSVPLVVLHALGEIFGKRDDLVRIESSLLVDASRARAVLGWAPRVGVMAGIETMAQAYRDQRGS
jgi:nucleoside-diphosphate-sugar epimerase